MRESTKKGIIGISVAIVASLSGLGVAAVHNAAEEQKWQRICDGTTIVSQCQDADGTRYNKYVYHKAEPEETKKVNHPATPAKTRTVHHDTVYGTRRVRECIKTSISYKSGTCALSRCNDGSYSGSTGRGTCSYHGGVWYKGGPWYEYHDEKYIVTPAWDEVIEVEPAKAAWTETIVIKAAKEAWTEKEVAR